jgi:membrane protease YdiL (CAAX protease family)
MNYIQQAYTGENKWFHWVLTIVLVFIGWQILGVIPLTVAAFLHSADLNEFIAAGDDSFMSLGMNKNLFLFLMLFMFAVGLFFLCIAMKYIHKRTVTSLVTSRKNIDWKRFWFGFLSWGIVVVLLSLIGILLAPDSYTFNFNPKPFFILVAISIVFIPLQTSLEELLFRGYFMQGLGVSTLNKRFPLVFNYLLLSILSIVFLSKTKNYSFFNMVIVFTVFTLVLFFLLELKPISKFFNSTFNNNLVNFYNSKLTPLLITSVCFGLLHGANPEVQKLGSITMIFYIGTGFFYGITTLMDEGTELALGLHASNNMIAAFLITTDWMVFQTDALFIDTSEPSVTWEMFIPVFILYPLILVLFSKKYGWTNWLEKLTGKVENPLSIEKKYSNLDEIGAE